MKALVPVLVLVIGASFLSSASLVADSPTRSFDRESRVLTSTGDPVLRLTVPTDLHYLGGISIDLGEKARVDRQVFARVVDARVEALLILQFEGLVQGVPGSYSFSIPPDEQLAGSNYRFSPQPVRLGSHDWVHNTWAFDNAVSAREKPGYESDRTARFVAERGLELPPELIMSRFVRAVGEGARRELILFYIEPLALHGHALAEFPDGGPISQAYDRLSAEITQRSMEIFSALEEPATP